MKKLKSPRVMLVTAMGVFGTLGLFVRNIPVASGELALYRAIMAALLSLVHRSLLSPMGLSVAGAFCFNLGQALVGFVTVGRAMLAYFPYMGLLSIPAGLATGFLCMLLMRRLAAREAPAKAQA